MLVKEVTIEEGEDLTISRKYLEEQGCLRAYGLLFRKAKFALNLKPDSIPKPYWMSLPVVWDKNLLRRMISP